MRTPAYYTAKANEMERLAAACPPGGERDALLRTVEHLQDLASLAAWREREPRTSIFTPPTRPTA